AIHMSEVLFSGKVNELKEEEIEELLGSLKKPLEEGKMLEDVLIDLGAATSKRDARTFLQGNAVSLNGAKESDPKKIIDKSSALYGKYVIIRRGKKNYYLGVF
ncbi:MAG: tyrosine--tRNA ligase, partial [Bacilli bacterium]|nr:tyrosine--tRNA ligase [Bacilli bacterium]